MAFRGVKHGRWSRSEMAYTKFSNSRGKEKDAVIGRTQGEPDDISSFSDFSRELPSIETALGSLRQHLVSPLSSLADTELLVLVRHAVEYARERTRGRGYRYCVDCGLRLSVIATSSKCGFCGSKVNH